MQKGLLPTTIVLLLGSLPFLAKANEPLTFATVQKQIETRQIKRIEDLLPLLPEDYRSKFSLIYKSESAQGATPAQPRVILFGDSGDLKSQPTAQLIMAFTGDSQQTGGQILETIEFSPENKNFVFRSVDFRADKPLIQENPAQCMKCHSQSLHPNWDTYDLWPGAVAGNHLGKNGLHPEMERQVIKDFLSSAPNHDRYKHLTLFSAKTPAEYVKALQELDHYNSRLTELLASYNRERILGEIASSPDFMKYKDAFEAAISNSFDFFSKFPDVKSARDRYEELLADSKKKAESYLKDRSERYLKITGMDVYADKINAELQLGELEAVAKLRLLAEDYLHIPTRDWPLTRFPDTYAFTGPQGGMRLLQNLWSVKNEEFLRLHQSKYQPKNQPEKSCSRAIIDSVSNLAPQS
jgi:hypothetical protein